MYQPELTRYGNMRFNRLMGEGRAEGVMITDEIAATKRELRKEIGLWRYIQFTLMPLTFLRKLS